MTNLDVEIADWREWLELGTRLSLCAGVHAPSAFSALLSSTMSSCAGLTVIDAGSGAGLVTIAALLGGATQVIAIDNDPAALRVTAHNVAEVLGPAGTDRLTTLELDFADLGGVSADLLAVNPPSGRLGSFPRSNRISAIFTREAAKTACTRSVSYSHTQPQRRCGRPRQAHSPLRISRPSDGRHRRL